MTNDLHDLHTSLDEYAEAAYAEAPPSTVDIGKARADGRRRLRAARLAPIGGGVAVVAVCALVVTTLGGTTAQRPAAQSPASTPGKTTAHRVFTTGTDPLVAEGTFGWLPHGLTGNAVTSGTGHSSNDRSDQIQARSLNGTAPSTDRLVGVAFSATEPPLPGGAAKRPATVPGAKTAYFVTIPGTRQSATAPSETMLVWQSANDTWAQLNAVPGEEDATLVKVASGVTFGDHDVPMPIHVEGVPKDLPIVGASSTGGPSDPDWSMELNSGVQAGTNGLYSVSVRPFHPGDKPANLPSSAPAGSQAVVYDVKCKEDAGLFICVTSAHPNGATDPLASVGGPQGLLNRITSLGTDSANWTTHVVN